MVINEQFLEDYDGRTLPWARPAGSPSVLAPALLDLAVVVEMVFYVVAVLAVPGPNGEDQGGPTASASKQSWAGSSSGTGASAAHRRRRYSPDLLVRRSAGTGASCGLSPAQPLMSVIGWRMHCLA